MLDKLRGHRTQVGQDINRPVDHIRLLEGHALVLAEFRNAFVHFFEVVARNLREEVVLHLVLEAAAEIVDERLRYAKVSKGTQYIAKRDLLSPAYLRDAFASRDVARRGDLQLPEIRAILGVVNGHAIVPQAKDEGQKQASENVAQKHESHELPGARQAAGISCRISARDQVGHGEVPEVVYHQTDFLSHGRNHFLAS